jgi:hypothetical protein
MAVELEQPFMASVASNHKRRYKETLPIQPSLSRVRAFVFMVSAAKEADIH